MEGREEEEGGAAGAASVRQTQLVTGRKREAEEGGGRGRRKGEEEEGGGRGRRSCRLPGQCMGRGGWGNGEDGAVGMGVARGELEKRVAAV